MLCAWVLGGLMVWMEQRRWSSVLWACWTNEQVILAPSGKCWGRGEPQGWGAQGKHLPRVEEGLRKSFQEKVMSNIRPGGGGKIN